MTFYTFSVLLNLFPIKTVDDLILLYFIRYLFPTAGGAGGEFNLHEEIKQKIIFFQPFIIWDHRIKKSLSRDCCSGKEQQATHLHL